MRKYSLLAVLFVAPLIAAAPIGAQTPAQDPSARLREVLPADVAARVLAVIEAARSRGLPAAALENRALKFAARGVAPKDIERSTADQARRMIDVRDTLEHARGRKPSGDEIEAGAEVLRRGVDGSKVSALAKSAPSGRSLAVPLFVIGSLMDRGLPSDSALSRVLARLQARAADRDLERMPGELPAQANGQGRPATPGAQGNSGNRQTPPAMAPPAGRPVAGPPAGVPANGGKATRPTPPAKGTVPASKRP
jgi:hypothetical protein